MDFHKMKKMEKTIMKQLIAVIALSVCFGAFADSVANRPSDLADTFSLNADWRFTKAPVTIPLAQAKASVETNGVKVEDPAFDDSAWEAVSVPHPINARDSFDNHAVDAGESSFWRGMAFYRKRFTLDAAPKGKAFLTFETVRQTIYLWVNGKFAGYYEAGIAPTAFDVTSLLKNGENVVCVATDNCAARGTKLFTLETIPGHEPGDMSGRGFQWNTTDFNEVQGGLVGNVSLVLKKSKTYLTLPYYNNLKTVGTYVTAKDFDFEKGAATICVKAEVRNEDVSRRDAEAQRLKVRVEVREIGTTKTTGTSETSNTALVVSAVSGVSAVPAFAPQVFLTALEGDVYSSSPQPTRVVSPETSVLEAECRATGLVFWSPDTPHLYDVIVTLVDENGAVLDSETIRTGFRKVEYDAAKGGLLLNGKNVWLTGYAQRSTDEWAAIGVAPDWLQDYDAALIRKSNANFVRWMHVAPKPAPVRAFDKFGVVNVCPAGDKENDVSGRGWAQRVEAMRDVMIFYRNSPSILFWEAGNNHISPAHMKEMVELKKAIDPDGGRFMGCRTLQTKEEVAEAEYVGTMLHRHEMPAFDSMKALGRFLPMMETEYARQESPRRCWDDYTPPDYDYRGKFLNGGKKETGFDVYDQTQEDFALSTAKEYAQFYGARASGRGAKTYSAAAALCWTDSNQHGRQSFSENCRSSGRVDAVRLPKENFDVYRVIQSEDPAVMLVGHWSYPKLTKETYWYPLKKYNGHFMEETGEMAQRDPLHKKMYAIGSVHCASVELVVNGKSKGVVKTPKDAFVWELPQVDVTESGYAEVIARDKSGNVIARHAVRSFEGDGKIETSVKTGPKGWLADGADIAMVDFRLVDANGTVHPFASEKISFELSFEPDKHTATSNFKLSTSNSPVFMGGYNSGAFDETSPIGKDWVNLECGVARVFVKAGRTPGKVTLKWSVANSNQTIKQSKKSNNGVVELELKPFETKGGISAAPQQEYPANARTFARRTSAEAVQDLAASDTAKAVSYTVRVNGAPVAFAKGMGKPVKPDDNTGVCCAYVPVLAALKAAGAQFEYSENPKKIPANKKWLRNLSPTPYRAIVTVKAGGREIDACVGFTELFLDNGKDKNLTNCEIYGVGKKNQKVVCGELAALVGYIPGVEITTDTKTNTIELKVKAGHD